MGAMKTPGVYIVEKNAFPNSVVEVATAVPAFIGHTEFADNHNTPLLNKPWRITSMAEYRQYFGGPPMPRFELVPAADKPDFKALTEPDKPASAKGFALQQLDGSEGGSYGLYAGLRHFFQNNGGACYIVSVGNYKQALDLDKFKQGIAELLKEQEPTMLVIPEAVRFSQQACTDLQQEMLAHCGNKMRNRVAILDVWNGDKPREFPKGDPVAAFRDSLGINFLDFAAAYYPWLETTVVGEKELSFENIAPASAPLFKTLLRAELNLPETLPAEPTVAMKAMHKAVESITTDFEAEVIADAVAAAHAKADAALTKQVEDSNAAKDQTPQAVAALVKAALEQAATEREAAKTAARAEFKEKAVAKAVAEGKSEADAETVAEAAAVAWAASFGATLSDEQLKAAVEARKSLLDKTLNRASSVYKAVMTEARRRLNVLPPSAAMAGVYTMVDNTRGVWKAPANVSLAGVIRPTVSISADQQEDLNVTAQGKSINAIRSFIGEGVLVWGARTLDGNSLDWRYINVRRTMIMLEESCRLAAKAMVFEPNTANTWVTIKSMISNFLTSIWKRGGLMGAVPEDAFSVHVGLGETMTPDDILEGILRVTVLVAMVRPAEFIEITFQQQMPKS